MCSCTGLSSLAAATKVNYEREKPRQDVPVKHRWLSVECRPFTRVHVPSAEQSREHAMTLIEEPLTT